MRRAGERSGERPRFFGPTVPLLLLLALLTISGGLILFLTRNMTFYQDTWAFLMDRRDPTVDSVLLPHNEHIAVFPVLIEQLILRVFGMASARPEYVLSVIGLLASASLLFVYLRRRVGDWLALFAIILVLFLGPAWEVLLWPFEIGFVGSVFFGLAGLLSMEREDRRGDIAACICLTLSAGFSDLGIPFMVGGVVAFLLGPRQRWLRRAYVVLVPVLLFGAWYVGWGHEAESHISLANALNAPQYVAESIAVNVGAALGLNPDPTTGALGRGPNPEAGLDPIWSILIVTALVVALVARRVIRGSPVSPRFWPAAAIALMYWALLALNNVVGREPTDSRYQYGGAVLALMLVASLFDGFRPKRLTLAVAGTAAVLTIVPHVIVLGKGADFLDEQSVLARADTAAIEISRNTVEPTFQLTPEVAGTPTLPNIYAGQYLTATREYGSPAYSLAELRAAPEAGRFQADVVLAHALPMNLSTHRRGFDASGGVGCTVMRPGNKSEVALAPGTTTRIEVAPGPDVSFFLRRFAIDEYPIKAEHEPGGSVSRLTIPADTTSLPWHLLVEATQLVRVCN
jgi:hypothetical protein